MQKASLRLDHWPSIVSHVGSVVDLDTSARTHKALLRKRGVRCAAGLLHLALLYGPGGLSLRSVASHATKAGIADVCDVSLLDRLRNAGDFLADVLDRLLADRRGDTPTDGRLQLNLVMVPQSRYLATKAATGACMRAMSRRGAVSPILRSPRRRRPRR